MQKTAKAIDMCMILFVMGMFCLVNFLAFTLRDHFLENVLMLSILFLIMIVNYFAGLTAAIVLSAIAIFFYGSYVLYYSVVLGYGVGTQVYVWVIAILYNCFVVGIMRNSINYLQTTNKDLKKEYSELITIDSVTRLDNIKAFYNELSQCMSLAKRYKIPLCLMLIRINHYDEIENIIGSIKMGEVLKSISNSIVKDTRLEDEIFKLEGHGTFALVLYTDTVGATIVKNRVKDDINVTSLKIFTKGVNVHIDLRVGISQYQYNEQDIMNLKELAEKEMEYDV